MFRNVTNKSITDRQCLTYIQKLSMELNFKEMCFECLAFMPIMPNTEFSTFINPT